MAKILTDKELGDIIYKATHDSAVIDDGDSYEHFLEDLGNLIADHFGGQRGTVDVDPDDELGFTVAFHMDVCVPSDGGIYKDYDTDVIWKDGVETKQGQDRESYTNTQGRDTYISEDDEYSEEDD